MDSPGAATVRAYRPATDRAWLAPMLDEGWGGPWMARRGELLDVAALDGFVALAGGTPAGVLTYRPDGDATELAFLWAFTIRRGIGTELVRTLLATVPGSVWVVTTNDNLAALAFYEHTGFRVRSVRPGAVDDARARLKPSIPVMNANGIPCRDEVELVFER
ncbi:MAG TPA: GNAT family N-acetyltransferase [Acidimicrobiia bacterium]|nr:GNAT family N-acetyltransferase [Acidimicrobiia bacterium]